MSPITGERRQLCTQCGRPAWCRTSMDSEWLCNECLSPAMARQLDLSLNTTRLEKDVRRANMERQFKLTEMRVLLCHARIMAGMLPPPEWAKCERILGTMDSHVRLLACLAEELEKTDE